jgi:hypothetical protein
MPLGLEHFFFFGKIVRQLGFSLCFLEKALVAINGLYKSGNS